MMRKNAWSRILALCLTIAMCLSILPLSVLAAPGDEEETEPQYPYLDTSLSDEERALDLVSRMTPEEKYAQLQARTAPAIPRLGVNAYDWWSEALHGVARDGKATSFPTGLGIAATWDVDMVEAMMSATSDEARDKFNNHVNDHGLSYWSPTINMARDPRWGRAEETYGEDPYLSGMIAEAFINGLQGDQDDVYKTIATPKHFLGNNSEQNRHNGSSNIDERDLREYYTLAFKYAVEEAHAGSVMTSYNAVNGVPMSVNEPIIDDIVRRTWGFDGYFVTDCGALQDIVSNHTWRPEGWGDQPWTGASTSAYAIMAGTDLNCGSVLSSNTGEAVNSGLLSEDAVDRALVRLFTARMKTGEFDPDGGYYGGDQFDNQIQSDDHVQLAETSADNAVVLLENKDDILPFGSDISNLVLVGDCANELILGDYSTNEPENTSTALEGIEAALKRANPDAEFTYIEAKGGNYSSNLMNTRGPKLLNAEGEVVGQIDLSQNIDISGCRVENGPNYNIGYNSDGCWIKFAPGSIDFTGVTQFSVEMSGDTNIQPTRVEIRATDPKSGPLLGSYDGQGSTGGWNNYVTYTFDANLGGGYTDQPIYMVLKAIPQEADFTEEESAAIKNADAVVYFGGTRPGENGFAEERDGANLNLPNNQNDIISTVAKLNPNTVVYLQAVSQINVEPFKDDVKAILWSTYNGQAQGNAAGRLLFGEANPSAKLPFTWYTDVDQLADIKDYTMRPDEETGNLGRTYQYFTGDVTYPFGYGMSYTTFEYSNLKIDKDSVTPDDTITVTFDVTNTGDVDGQEVAELYVVSPDAAAKGRPVKRLEGFDKKLIGAGQTEHFTLTLDAGDLWYWDADNEIQTYDQGTYVIQVGADSKACEAMTAEFTLSGQLTKEIHTATAIPSGHILDMQNPRKTITTELTAAYNDQSFVDLSFDDVTVKYESADPAVATVDENGVVRAVGGGLTTITASVEVGGVTKTDSFAVKVIQSVYADNIYLDGADLTGYDPDTISYNVPVENLDVLPVVTVDVNDSFDCDIQQASTESPTATVTVTLGDETVTYTINFVIPPKSFDFTETTEEDLLNGWTIVNEDNTHWTLDENGLTLTTQKGDFYQDGTDYKNLFLQPAAGDWVMEAAVEFEYLPKQPYQQAAIMAFQDDDNYLKLSYEYGGQFPKVQFGWESGAAFSNGFSKELDATTVYYRLEKVGNAYTGYYSLDGEAWELMGTHEVALANPKIALVAINSYQDADPMDVTFKYMTITQTTNCTCSLYNLTTDDDMSFEPQGTTPVTHELQASVKVRGGCQVEGHQDMAPTFTYEILPGSESHAAIDGDVLSMPRAGQVKVRVTAQLNEAEPLATDVTYTVTGYNVEVADSTAEVSGAGAYAPGDVVTVKSGDKAGYTFSDWMCSDSSVTFDNPYSETATFTMPDHSVTVTAQWDEVSVSAHYPITVTQAAGGKISPAATVSVIKGGDKTFTITPDEGYQIADVLVDGKSVGAVSTYTFKNVTARHTITAKFEKNGETVDTVAGFTDVKTNDWFADAVQYAVDNGLMNGTSSDKFTPKGATTRGMIVTILYRQAGSPDVESDGATWWSDARVWAMENGVSDGTNMEKAITREQLATMLYRYAELNGEDVSKTASLEEFQDANAVSAYAVDALKWAVAEGIVTGKTGGIIDPLSGATRAETATMFMRFCELT